MADRLAAFLAGRQPGAVPEIRGFTAITGGNARRAWTFDLVGDLADGTGLLPCILLAKAEDGQLETDLGAEFRTLRALEGSAVPAPRALWLDETGAAFGGPAMILERVSGAAELVPLLAAEPAATNAALARRLAEAAAAIHSLDWPARGLAFLDAPAPADAALRQVLAWEDVFLRQRTAPHPVIVGAFRWLKQRAPVAERISLVHGDLRFGNFLYEGDRLTAVLDWEMAHLGDPVEDIAWAWRRLWAPRHLPLEEFIAHYAAAGGPPVPPDSLRFWRLFGEIKHAVISLTGARAFAEGRTGNLRMADRLTMVPDCLAQFLAWLPLDEEAAA
jgi:aminoglycoside phosphotransferase (APT) family kinase protein